MYSALCLVSDDTKGDGSELLHRCSMNDPSLPDNYQVDTLDLGVD